MTRPSPIPAPDRHQIDALNTRYLLTVDAPDPPGWRGRLIGVLRRFTLRLIGPLIARQQAFNVALVDHLNRADKVGLDAHLASEQGLAWADHSIAEVRGELHLLREEIEAKVAEVERLTDDVRRRHESSLTGDLRAQAGVERLAAAHEALKASVGVLQVATQGLRREIERPLSAPSGPSAPSAMPAPPGDAFTGSVGSYRYVSFEERFRGAPEAIRERQTAYLPLFAAAADVVDIGCGRGEFLALLSGQGIAARGVDVNRAMVQLCLEQGLDVAEGDALAYLRAQPDESLGGLMAAQVVEHLEPAYLAALLDAAFAKLRPGSPIVLETINPACWYAFFAAYIRDVTHVRPLHPDTLQYMLLGAGFHPVDVRYLNPYPDSQKLQPVSTEPGTALADVAETLNANVDRLNNLLFTWLDYAAVGRRP